MLKPLPIYLILILLPSWITGQLVPPIRNYGPEIYRAENQNWDVTQASDGRMFFANNAGLLEFNGENWQRYPASNSSILRSVLALGPRVYSGCYMDFGYWERDIRGKMQYTSLSDTMEEPLLEDEQFWNIREVGNWILFQSLQRIYAYDVEAGGLQVIPSSASRARLFTEGEAIYFVSEGNLMTLVNGTAQKVVAFDPDRWELVGMARAEGRRVFVAEDGTLLEVKENGLVPLNTPLMDQLPAVKIYCTRALRDGSLALGTISQGLYILSLDGRMQLHLNKDNGLNNNTVLSLAEDRDGNLWIGLDNGISVLNRSSAFREYNDAAGILGEVYTAALFQDQLYVGTNQGLFRSSYPKVGPFEFVPGSEGQVWKLKEVGGILFCGHNRGTFVVEGTGVRRIPGPEGTWDFKRVPESDSLLLQGHYQGLSLLVKRDGDWTFRNTLEGYDISSRFFEFLGPHRLMVNHEYKGIYTLRLDESWNRISVEARRPPSGIGASLFKFGKHLKYATDDAVFEWHEASGEFRPDSLLTNGLKERPNRPYGILIPDENAGRLWGFGDGTIHFVEAGKIDERLQFNQIHVPESFRVNMGVLGFECLANLGGGQYLIGRSNGFVILDLQHSTDIMPKPEISRVRRELVGENPELLPLEGIPEMSFGPASLRITYHVSAYEKFREVRYQHRLKGYRDSWSNWTTEPMAFFSNLPHGEYRFEVRARVGDSLSQAPAAFSFVVLPPWYLTRWALATYILLFLTFLYGVHLAYRAYYRGQQRKIVENNRAKAKREALRAEKKLAEARNEKLRQEIEGKNRELAISTMSLIKKNEFLRSLKSELTSAGEDPKIKKVLKTIDRNIGSEADWEFFETAFNNADKDFLKHIREQHPDLTPSDLRLCAYLRLNLSSKEIAPLLNISVRSVEVKRYRLRKKLGLSRDVSLSDYILDF